MSPQVGHRGAGFALAGKEYLVGSQQVIGVVGEEGFHADTSQCIDNRIDIACIVFYDCYFQFLLHLLNETSAKVRISF